MLLALAWQATVRTRYFSPMALVAWVIPLPKGPRMNFTLSSVMSFSVSFAPVWASDLSS